MSFLTLCLPKQAAGRSGINAHRGKPASQSTAAFLCRVSNRPSLLTLLVARRRDRRSHIRQGCGIFRRCSKALEEIADQSTRPNAFRGLVSHLHHCRCVQSSKPPPPSIERPKNMVWGYLDSSSPPVLTVSSRDTVTLHSFPAGGKETLPDDPRLVLADYLKALERCLPGRAHISSRPVYVKGAQAGDRLQIEILGVRVRQDWGLVSILPLLGTLPEEFTDYVFPFWQEPTDGRSLEADLRTSYPDLGILRASDHPQVGGQVDILNHGVCPRPPIGYANMFGPISPLISMIASAGMLFLRAAARIASGLGAS
jgi:Acetamidase/Formamidase family